MKKRAFCTLLSPHSRRPAAAASTWTLSTDTVRVSDQPALFELAPARLPAVVAHAEVHALAVRIPPSTHLATMSWAYAGWNGLLYDGSFSEKKLAEAGLTAYSEHPLLRGVEIDRSYYRPLTREQYRDYAAQTPSGFRFTAKAPLDCTAYRYPQQARYGDKGGQRNPLYLDPSYAIEQVIAPIFTRAYAEALVDGGAVHCHNVYPSVPTLLEQIRMFPPATRRPLLVRWLMRRGDDYDTSMARSLPFHRIALEDPENLTAVARVVRSAQQHQVPALVAIDNRAEGSAPLTAARLARALVET